MKTNWSLRILILIVLFLEASTKFCQQNQRFPKILNLYGSILYSKSIDEGAGYWNKLGMIIGGGSDWHYNYDSQIFKNASQESARKIGMILKSNPLLIALPYVDVIDGIDNALIPENYWLKGSDGKRVSHWPGLWRVNTTNSSVLQFTFNAIQNLVYSEKKWNGVFLDCWSADSFLVPMLRKNAPDRLIMTNSGSLPDIVSPLLNGALSEGDLNQAVIHREDIRYLMERYHKWMKYSAKPALTSISCFPRNIENDPWSWSNADQSERNKIIEKGRTNDLSMMRFGLCFTLMDDGYFAYDGGGPAHGSWWWYPEYDAPIGVPMSDAVEIRSALWKREFTGASIWVNGSDYDEPIHFKNPMKDFSSGRIAYDFILPHVDGRFFLPANLSDGAVDNGIPPDQEKFLIGGSKGVIHETNSNGNRWQFPNGLEIFLGPNGLLETISWKGKAILNGGHPLIVLPGVREVKANPISGTQKTPNQNNISSTNIFEGSVNWKEDTNSNTPFLQDDYRLSIEQGSNGGLFITIQDNFYALKDFNTQMWRHYFFFPINTWAGHPVSFDNQSSKSLLPVALDKVILGNGKEIQVEGKDYNLKVKTNITFGLIDHRKHGTQDYLWAGYPTNNQIKKDNKIFVELRVEIYPKDRDGL